MVRTDGRLGTVNYHVNYFKTKVEKVPVYKLKRSLETFKGPGPSLSFDASVSKIQIKEESVKQMANLKFELGLGKFKTVSNHILS